MPEAEIEQAARAGATTVEVGAAYASLTGGAQVVRVHDDGVARRGQRPAQGRLRAGAEAAVTAALYGLATGWRPAR